MYCEIIFYNKKSVNLFIKIDKQKKNYKKIRKNFTKIQKKTFQNFVQNHFKKFLHVFLKINIKNQNIFYKKILFIFFRKSKSIYKV